METLDVQQLTVVHTEQQLRAKEYHAERKAGGHDRKPRMPLPADTAVPGGHRVVVLSDYLWRSQFGSDPGIVGTQVRLNRELYEVIGVAPPAFRGAVWPTFESALWVPAMMAGDYLPGADVLNGRFFAIFQTIGRLTPGTRYEAVQARIDPLDAVLSEDRDSPYYTNTGAPWRVRALPGNYLRLWPEYREDTRVFLTIFGLMAVAALAVASANMATLLLARAIEWRRELAIRHALGATRVDLARRLGVEVLLLLFAGGLGASALVVWLSPLVPLLPLTVPYELDLVPDLRVLGIGLIVALVTGCAFAIPPVWRVLHGTPNLATLSRTVSVGRSTAMSALVIVQVALSLILVMGCGLLLRSAWNTHQIDPGFHALEGVTARIEVPQVSPDDPGATHAFVERLLEGLRSEALVVSASASTDRPLAIPGRVEVRFADSRTAEPDTSVRVGFNRTTADYFETFAIPVHAGRLFTSGEVMDGAPVAVINQALATQHWSGLDPVGRSLRLTEEEQPRRIIGVVSDTLSRNISVPAELAVYVPFGLRPQQGAWLNIRLRGGEAGGQRLLREHVARLDPTLAVSEQITFAGMRRSSTRDSRVRAGLAAILAGIALTLALVGLYGLMGYLVHRREREMGIRTALGATPGNIVGLILGTSCRLALVGVALGLAASVGTNRLLTRLLYGVEPSDPLTFMLVPVPIITVAIIACWGPSLRAARVNPTEALRAE